MFAPQIAVALAGEAVAGLYGAALTNASLALLGGGSLAAGGLGMAGGTAVITGGGALLGMAAGTASLAGTLALTSKEYWNRQAAKIQAFCDLGIEKEFITKQEVLRFIDQIDAVNEAVQAEIKELEDEKTELNKEDIKQLKAYGTCFTRTGTELKKIVK